jgi:hypothetical protein
VAKSSGPTPAATVDPDATPKGDDDDATPKGDATPKPDEDATPAHDEDATAAKFNNYEISTSDRGQIPSGR